MIGLVVVPTNAGAGTAATMTAPSTTYRGYREMPLHAEYAPGTARAARRQAELYEASAGAEAGDLGGHPIVVLFSLGAGTGKLRKTALMRVERDGCYAVLASPDTTPRLPNWYFNVLANPIVELQDGADRRKYRAREVHGREREAWWELAVAAFPLFARYQAKKPRPIPIVVLEPV
jgi:deazaflavin-dependent oxidoreductase (nitroreductase family)